MRRRRQLFQREGEYWTVAFEDKVVKLRDLKGFHYLAALLQHPGESIHASMVVASVKARRGSNRASSAAVSRAAARADQGPVTASPADVERARLAVTKGIKTAIDRITAVHPALGRHLTATVRRGYFCSYTPDPRLPIEWIVSRGMRSRGERQYAEERPRTA